MIKLNNPFIKLIDRTHTQTLINEQIMGLSGQTTDKTAVNAGELIGVKAILTGKLVSFSKIKKPVKKEVKKAWIERKVKKYNPDTEKNYFESEYDKITYNEFHGSNEVNISFQYQLISTESGEILLTDIVKLKIKMKFILLARIITSKTLFQDIGNGQIKKTPRIKSIHLFWKRMP